jgi:surfactin synthase thioesterase subunit
LAAVGTGRTRLIDMSAVAGSRFMEHGAWFHHWRVGAHSRLRLVCLPYAGGGGMIYRRWSDSPALPENVAICSVQLPARENRYREPGYRDMDALLDDLVGAMAHLGDLPFVLFGHSMGAFIGFELAAAFRRQGMKGPAHLIVSGANAPSFPQCAPVARDRDLDDDEIIRRVRYLGGTRDSVFVNPELLKLMMPMLRADFSMLDRYRPREDAVLECPITAFGGRDDHIVSLDGLAAWSNHTAGMFSMEVLPGDHFFINHQRVGLLERIGRVLGEVAA